MAEVTIDVAGMRRVLSGLEEGMATVERNRDSLRATMDRFDVDSSRIWAVARVLTWAEGGAARGATSARDGRGAGGLAS